jgi:hypothetical protein
MLIVVPSRYVNTKSVSFETNFVQQARKDFVADRAARFDFRKDVWPEHAFISSVNGGIFYEVPIKSGMAYQLLGPVEIHLPRWRARWLLCGLDFVAFDRKARRSAGFFLIAVVHFGRRPALTAREQAKAYVFDCIEVYCNRQHLDSTFGYRSRVGFELSRVVQAVVRDFG